MIRLIRFFRSILGRFRDPQMEIEVTVTRADGTVENYGVVAKGRVSMQPESGGN